MTPDPTQTSGTPSGGTQAVDRAAAIVRLVVEADEAVGIPELSAATGLARSTLSRLLTALERNGLLDRTEPGSYVAGSLFGIYAARHDSVAELARIARATLEQIGEQTSESVHLAVPRGGGVANVDQVDSRYVLGARDWTTVDVPAHCSALGKVLLAYDAMPGPVGRLETPTELTLSTQDALAQDLARIRKRGYAVTLDELEVGLTGIAAPVRAGDGEVIAAIGVSGPTARLEDSVEELGRLLIARTDALSALLRRRTHKEGVA